MVYEVCALVATITLGVLGIEITMTVRSARQLTNEAKQTLHDVNAHLPQLLMDAQNVTHTLRETSDHVSGSFNQAAVTLEMLKGNSLRSATEWLTFVKEGIALWEDIRNRKDRKDHDE